MRPFEQAEHTEHVNKDLVRLWLAVAIAVLHAAYWLSVHLVDRVRLFFEPYTTFPAAQWLTGAVFVWLLALLWVANRRWRDSIRREAELERVLASIAYEALIVVTPDRTITHSTAAIEPLFGFRAQEVVGRKTDLLYSDRRLQPEQHEVHSDLDLVGFHIGHGTGHRKDGSAFPIELTTARLQGAEGAVIVIRDVTERKVAEENLRGAREELELRVVRRTAELQKAVEDLRIEAMERQAAERALKTSEATYRTLTEASPDMIYLIGADGRMLYINPRAAALLGRPAEEIIGRSQDHFFIMDDAARHQQSIQEVFQRGTALVRDSADHFSQADAWFDTCLVPILDDSGTTTAVLGISRDVTDRHRIEVALRESEEAFRTLVESAMSAIMIVSRADRILYSNRKGAEIVGSLSPNFLVGTDVEGVFTTTPWKEAAAANGEGASVRMETTVCRSDGERVPVDLAAAPTQWRGEPGTLLIFNDITYRREAESRMLRDQTQLRRLASELSLAEEGERRRIAVGLHDGIGQTLALCRIRLGSLLTPETSSPDAASALSDIRGLVDSAIRETRALTMDLSPPVLYELGIDAALEWLAEEMHRQYGKPIDFRMDRSAKPLDEGLRSVVFRGARELIVNAVKHANAKRIRMSSHRVGSHLHLTVEDDGDGFAASDEDMRLRHDSCFGLFYIRERMDFLGGNLVIDSHPGRGTRVTLVAPLKADAADGPAEAEAVQAPRDTP